MTNQKRFYYGLYRLCVTFCHQWIKWGKNIFTLLMLYLNWCIPVITAAMYWIAWLESGPVVSVVPYGSVLVVLLCVFRLISQCAPSHRCRGCPSTASSMYGYCFGPKRNRLEVLHKSCDSVYALHDHTYTLFTLLGTPKTCSFMPVVW